MADSVAGTGAVVIGRNEGTRLLRCLASLRGLEGPLVYVDSASTDGSVAAARELGADVVTLDMDRPFTAARARKEGFARLEALAPALEYVMFVDGDCEVEAGWLDAATRFLGDHPDFAVACGRRRERSPEASRYNALADREWDTAVGETTACGGDAVMRAAALREVGGFDPAMIAGEEPELCRRLRAAGWRIMRLGVPMTIHDAAMTRLGQWWLRAVRSGFGYAQACHRTYGRGDGPPLYARELARAIAWAGLLPLLAVMLALAWHPLVLLAWPAAAGVQYLRMAHRDGSDAAAMATLGKYAELVGALRYFARALRGSAGGTIVYK
ncbi:MAG TPA: glycosyltransferase [Croceibacterium sp.]|nr:glycosyltransferase [Croceibacterium sp.]